jgi:hypothetical protein
MDEIMSDRERNIFDMLRSTVQFDAVNAADYDHLPEAEVRFAVVRSVVAALENYAAAKTSGARGQAVERKSVIRAAMRRKMTDYARTARALNISDPGFRRLFSVPDGNNDEVLMATAREFVEEARRFKTEFAQLGIAASLADELEADIEALELAVSAKSSAHQEGVGATAGIDEQIELGMEAEKVLDAIMNNVYRNNPVKKAEWKTARHVRKRNTSPAPAPGN